MQDVKGVVVELPIRPSWDSTSFLSKTRNPHFVLAEFAATLLSFVNSQFLLEPRYPFFPILAYLRTG